MTPLTAPIILGALEAWIMLTNYTIRDMGNGVRCRWVYDEEYQTVGSYAYATEEETKEAEEWELERLCSGEPIALGCIVEHLCQFHTTHRCASKQVHAHTFDPETGEHWHETDSCWGIVIEPDDAKLDEFARHSMDLAHPGQPLVTLGARVAGAFLLDYRGAEFAWRFGALALPHPSGRCRVWNDPAAVERARMLIRCPFVPLKAGE